MTRRQNGGHGELAASGSERARALVTTPARSLPVAASGNVAANAAATAPGSYAGVPDYMGGQITYGLFCHTFETLVPPAEFAATHPEYFSMIDGRRRCEMSQLCLTNPDVLRLVVERVLEHMRANPEATIFSVSQNDWGNYCQCPKCAAITEAEGSLSGPLLRFVNAVAAETSKVFPDKLIDTLAYIDTLQPPRVTRPHPSVRVRLCPIRCCQGHQFGACDHPNSKAFIPVLEKWAELTGQLYLLHYCTNFRHYLLPMPNLDELQANVNLYRRLGVSGVFMLDLWTGPMTLASGESVRIRQQCRIEKT